MRRAAKWQRIAPRHHREACRGSLAVLLAGTVHLPASTEPTVVEPPPVEALADPAPPPRSPLEALTALAPPQAVSWRDRYELGAGDVVNVAFFGRASLDRPGIRVAPDGTLSYLQANSIPVAGLTIDELRAQLEEYLRAYYRNVRFIVTPAELVSKRYVILGEVMDKGVYPLDRPVSLLEAIARSRGVNTGLVEGSTIETADLGRSFVVRQGQRLEVDLEALYHEGDLSQNVQLEPGDYIYIASGLSNSFYVFGAVAQPGVQSMNVRMGVIAALTRREGFTEAAWRQRVLLVRGRLSEPETRVINVRQILRGEAPDVQLEPGDILYVNTRPWYRAEQVLDSAIGAFIQSSTSAWVSANVPNIVEEPLIPNSGWRDDP